MRFHGLALLLIGGVACGETARRPQGRSVENGAGEAPSSNAGSGAPTGQGGAAPLARGGAPAAGAPDEDKDEGGGEGGELSRDPEYRFVVLPSIPRPEILPNPSEPTDKLSYATSIQAMSSDASVVVGISYAILSQSTEPFAVVTEDEVYWTNLAQPQRLGTAARGAEVCLAEDGSGALFTSLESPELLHWTRAQGISSVPVADRYSPALIGCSADAQRGAFRGERMAMDQPYYWQRGDSGLTEVEMPASTWFMQFQVAKDPGPAILIVSEPVSAGVSGLRPYSWTPDMGAQPLPMPAGESCDVGGASADHAVLAGQCDSGGFILRSGGLTMLGPQVRALGVSRDGSTVLGAVPEPGAGERLVSWQGGAAQQVTTAVATWWAVASLSADGLSAYVRSYGGGGQPSTFKWTADGRVTPLPSLAGYEQIVVSLANADEGVAFGYASNPSQDFNPYDRMVVWDASGARDVKHELEAAGVWPKDVRFVAIEGLSVSGKSIFIQGSASVPGHKLYTGVVLVLPLR